MTKTTKPENPEAKESPEESKLYSGAPEVKVAFKEGLLYFKDRIEPYSAFQNDFAVSPVMEFEHTTFERLEGVLKEDTRLRSQNEKPVIDAPYSITVDGILFPSALLTSGWWTRLTSSHQKKYIWRGGKLQQWLFKGFDLWAPSWDFTWQVLENGQTAYDYMIAQFGEGDEANTIPVIIPKDKLNDLQAKMKEGWGGAKVVINGVIGHRTHFKNIPQDVKLEGNTLDYCIILDANMPKHSVTVVPGILDIYSGYLWKCVVPKDWVVLNEEGSIDYEKKSVNIDEVFFIWEHTNFIEKDALEFNREFLLKKEESFAKKYGDLILLQESSPHVHVKGRNPVWNAKEFYEFLLKGSKH